MNDKFIQRNSNTQYIAISDYCEDYRLCHLYFEDYFEKTYVSQEKYF